MTDLANDLSRAPHGLSFRQGEGVCFLHKGLYHYIVCTRIYRSNGCYAFFYTPIAPSRLPPDTPERFPGMNPSSTAWDDTRLQHLQMCEERTDLRFQFAETNVQYSLFPRRRRTCVCIGPAGNGR